MASVFKQFISDDIATTRSLLHEAIPISGSIVTTGANIKSFAHQMFQSVYDYTYTNSSANHIFDITHGSHPERYGNSSAQTTASAFDYFDKRKNVYNQMAQVLVGHDVTGGIRKFDKDGDFVGSTSDKYNSLLFLNFSRLLAKDEIKKGSFKIKLSTSVAHATSHASSTEYIIIEDYQAESNHRVNSPAGEYAILKITGDSLTANPTGNSVHAGLTGTNFPCGLIFYQAGIVAIDSRIFDNMAGGEGFLTAAVEANSATDDFATLLTTDTTMDAVNTAFRERIMSIDFNNTTELNSTIYFCRVGHNDFNYSSNPTYLEDSKVRTKNRSTDAPVSYITTVGLYDARNELLAVAKLSEPLRKDPTNDITLRVRLDY